MQVGITSSWYISKEDLFTRKVLQKRENWLKQSQSVLYCLESILKDIPGNKSEILVIGIHDQFLYATHYHQNEFQFLSAYI